MVQAEQVQKLECLGQGATGIVYRGSSKAYHCCVIKTGPRDRLRREGEVLEHLHHPNVVHLYAQGSSSPSQSFLVLQRLGRSLHQMQQAVEEAE